MLAVDRPVAVDVQRCPSCESLAVQQSSGEDGKVWLACGRCHLRWSIAERRVAAIAEYRGCERRLRVYG